jgi:cyclophilin family peptidyl-prolyl cis-trans isomerase
MRFLLLRLLVMVLLLGALPPQLAAQGRATLTQPQDQAESQWAEPPSFTIDPEREYFATVATNFGAIELRLFPAEAPLAVNNFVFLASQQYYAGTPFHRVIKNFMIQTGDPTGTGRGGPGYRFADEPVIRGYDRGIVAMANAGPDTNGSQFFIVHGDDVDLRLPRNYTIFGEVVGGLEVVDAIASLPVRRSSSGEPSVPEVDVSINQVSITVQ